MQNFGKMAYMQHFESQVQQVSQTEVAVLRHVHRFPVTNKAFISENLVLGINHHGFARAQYDLQEVRFTPNEVSVVMPNHLLHQLECSEDYDITLLVISPSFQEEMRSRSLSHDYFKYHSAPAIRLDEHQIALLMQAINLIEAITRTSSEQMPNKHESLVYQVEVLFELLNSFRFEHDRQSLLVTRGDKLFSDFCDLVAIHYREARDVAFYADLLHLTPKHVARVIRRTCGIQPSRWIERYVIAQAQQVLSTRRDWNIQQVATHLGFNESAAFCRFFKTATGITPSEYREL